MPRIPWLWVIVVGGGLATILGMYYLRRVQRADALRAEILQLHRERLTDVARRYDSFRTQLEGWVQEAGRAGEPEQMVDPRLNLGGLRSGEGLYLRIPASAARDPRRIERAALTMDIDGITRCLALAPMSARGLYEKGVFLSPDWVRRVRREQDMMRLRVYDDQLGRHVQVDVPVLQSMMQADWFMLVLEQGANRRDHPVDVYLWDLRSRRQLLRARIQGRGLLVPVRVRFAGAHPPEPPGHVDVRAAGAADCSIASQLRELTGNQGVDFGSSRQLIEHPPTRSRPAATPR